MPPASAPSPSPPSPHFDHAAGGVLVKRAGSKVRIAAVYRRRYGDWTLPKGHLNAGETPEEAARREVLEETGCRGRSSGDPIPVSYLAAGKPKLVVYFRMELEQEGSPSDLAEVEKVEWFSPEALRTTLTHESERALIAKLFPEPDSWSTRLGKWWRERPRPEQIERAQAALLMLRREWERAPDDGPTPDRALWFDPLHRALNEAETLAERGELNACWGLVHLAERLALHAGEFRPEQRLGVCARLRREAQDKLSGWRLQTVLEILPEKPTTASPPSLAALVQAQRLLHDHFDTTYYKIQVLARRLRLLTRLLLFWLLLLWGKTWLWPEPEPGAQDEASIQVLRDPLRFLVVMLLGTFGALVSLCFDAGSPGGKIPQELGKANELLLRLAVGAAGAVVVVIFLEAGMIDLLDVTGPRVYPIAILAGFSDRLLNTALSGLESHLGKDAKYR